MGCSGEQGLVCRARLSTCHTPTIHHPEDAGLQGDSTEPVQTALSSVSTRGAAQTDGGARRGTALLQKHPRL